jgi:hypothetical protein
MKLHHALLAAVALGAVTAPNAHAAEKKHAKSHQSHAKAAPAKDAGLKSEVDELKAEVAALRSELHAQHDTTAQTQTQVATLQTETTTAAQTAATAATKADTAVAKAEAVQVATAKTDKKVATMAWAGDTKVSALAYFNASNINQQADGVKQPSNGTGFNVKRIYLTVDHKFSDIWSANVTTDISNVIGETAFGNYATPTTTVGAPTCTTTATPASATGYTTTCAAPAAANLGTAGDVGKGLYIKKAFIQAKIDPALIIRAGSADTAWIPYMEAQYEHRYLEMTLTDNYKLAQSADWGIYALGDLADGLLSYQVGVVNGTGYRNVKVTKSVDVDGRLSAQYKGFYAAVGGYTGRLGNNVQGAVVDHVAYRLDGALGFKNTLFNIGGEYVYAKNEQSVTKTTEDKYNGWSAFAQYNITPKWQVFGRADWIRYTPNIATGASVSNYYWNAGIQWQPAKLVDISLAYKRDTTFNLGGGTMTAQYLGTGTLGGTTYGTYDEVGLFGYFKF